MDRTARLQTEIEERKTAAIAGYPSLWRRMISEWQQPERNDSAWLMYSANYLFRTAGIRWALDPLTLHWRVSKAPQVNTGLDLQELSFIILTHRHADHLDLDLVHTLSPLPIRWVIPQSMLEVVTDTGLSLSKVIVPKPMEPFEMDGIKITSFDGLHWAADISYPDGRRGVPATGYLVEFSGKRWLFPGDTRTYDTSQQPSFGPVDGLFAHLWLGRGSALRVRPLQLKAFCSFYLDLKPKRIIVTHLEEFGRAADEYWDDFHAQKITAYLHKAQPLVDVQIGRMGERISL
jgi:L-ascorbate metabolism protein UlaG (beta-lactamase superfamily)